MYGTYFSHIYIYRDIYKCHANALVLRWWRQLGRCDGNCFEPERRRQLACWLSDSQQGCFFFTVCTGLLILSTCGHVSRWRSRILLHKSRDGPIQTHSRARQQEEKKKRKTKHLRSRAHTLAQVDVEGWFSDWRIYPGVDGCQTGWGPLPRLACCVPIHVLCMPMFQWLWVMPDNFVCPRCRDSSRPCWMGPGLSIFSHALSTVSDCLELYSYQRFVLHANAVTSSSKTTEHPSLTFSSL